MDATASSERIARVYRTEAPKVLATLVRRLGDLDLAEEAMHEAFAAAARQWPHDGFPAHPRAWLVATARFKAIDTLRRRARGDAIIAELEIPEDEALDDPDEVRDDQLRLVFMCCHPALPVEQRVALSLREVCGLRTEEVARCFLVSPEAMKKRLSRAKAQLREAKVAFEIPAHEHLRERLAAVLHVVYLVFNEGYAATSGGAHIRHELTDEALYLARLVVEVIPEPEAIGLLALLLLHASRSAARVDDEGNIVPLEAQDRSTWDRAKIDEAQVQIQRAIMSGRVGPYTLQASIASVHAAAPSVEETNWALIVDYYEMLQQLQPGPVVALQRAVAVAMRDGPEVGLALVESLLEDDKLSSYHSAYAIHADLARRAGRAEIALQSYDRAIALARQEPERRYLERQRDALAQKISE